LYSRLAQLSTLVLSKPLLCLEMCLGQFAGAGVLAVFQCCPLSRGLGATLCVQATGSALLGNLVLAYALLYMFHSWSLPWQTCSPDWGADMVTCFVADAQVRPKQPVRWKLRVRRTNQWPASYRLTSISAREYAESGVTTLRVHVKAPYRPKWLLRTRGHSIAFMVLNSDATAHLPPGCRRLHPQRHRLTGPRPWLRQVPHQAVTTPDSGALCRLIVSSSRLFTQPIEATLVVEHRFQRKGRDCSRVHAKRWRSTRRGVQKGLSACSKYGGLGNNITLAPTMRLGSCGLAKLAGEIGLLMNIYVYLACIDVIWSSFLVAKIPRANFRRVLATVDIIWHLPRHLSQAGPYLYYLLEWFTSATNTVLICAMELVVINFGYGMDRLVFDLTFMLQSPPSRFWVFTWKYTSWPCLLV
ncbi:unnamed protein product, partial [Ixodes hexagonus]